ncbi:hydrolase [Sulfoacidibacillus thermotolerans]|uniref:Isochorismatase-like domain-containing protein n=1 Tax=Sulfoacidibacillus thermotolerans TaxID=1765684 RepID=A0A2U3D6J9_SULT2|nr:hydrolase [Sulfoacidibacillus thermotolerans]PWI56904.1 hypothetical protein BM613_11310 [Sulfoacidibacillus thermotolerans]
MDLELQSKKTALVIIDLQKGIVQFPGAPNATTEVVANAAKLSQAFRKQGGFVVLVTVGSRDGGDLLHPIVDQPMTTSVQRSADFADLVPELHVQPTDHLVIKHQWGAFFGTDLDLQLRRRGIDTLVLCGIATNIGVETTAREAYQHNYQQIFVSDAMTGLTAAEHEHTLQYIFPRIGRIRTTEQVLTALGL